jgi:hypothetical protein
MRASSDGWNENPMNGIAIQRRAPFFDAAKPGTYTSTSSTIATIVSAGT